MASPYADEPSMPSDATRSMFLVAAGFGIGALIVLFGFVFLVGIGDLGHATISGPASTAQSSAGAAAPATPAAKSAANAPAAPGPAPKPAPNTAAPVVPSTTTGQAPAPANPKTPRAPTSAQQQH
jgi:hypothetical protein